MRSTVLATVIFLLGGCITRPMNPAATQPATAVAPQQASPDHWLDQPPVASVESHDFDRIWDVCQRVARRRLFNLDRLDYRGGVITTEPMTSKQFFEVWRGDVVTAHDLTESSLATIRRTIRFEITRTEGGSFRAVPKVLVERQVLVERRVTAASQYFRVLSPSIGGTIRRSESGAPVPATYWYAIGRDPALEKAIARSMKKMLDRAGPV